MLTLPIEDIPAPLGDSAQFHAALIHGLARDEVAGRRRPERLTEPDLATWKRFRGRLGARDLLDLVVEDAAVVQPIPFDRQVMAGYGLVLEPVPDSLAVAWVGAIIDLDLAAPSLEYIQAQARLLDLPSRLARSDLHQVKPHQKVLELPGTGGQLAHHLVSTQPGVLLQSNFLVACGSWRELTLAGLVALDLHAPSGDYLRFDPDLAYAREEVRRTSWDFVVGLAPEKGGPFQESRLLEFFPGARVVLV